MSWLMHKYYLSPPKKNAPKFLETLLFSIIVLLNIYLLFKNNSLQIKFVVDKKYFSMVHLMPMQILTDVKHELNVKFSAYAQYLFFRVVYRFRIWFVSKKKLLARLDIKTINKNKVSWIVLCLCDYTNYIRYIYIDTSSSFRL